MVNAARPIATIHDIIESAVRLFEIFSEDDSKLRDTMLHVQEPDTTISTEERFLHIPEVRGK